MSERSRIVLGEEDFADPPVEPANPRATHPPAAAHPAGGSQLPPVQRRSPTPIGAGPAPAAPQHPRGGSAWLHDATSAPLIAAAIGVLLGWVVTELFGIADINATSGAGLNATSGLWTGVIALVFGSTLLVFDRAVAGAWEAAGRRAAVAALPMLLVGFVSGYAAQAMYSEIFESILESVDSFDDFSANDVRFYLARGLAWAVFGAGIGAAIGLVERSSARAINGAIGGAIGGAAGGLAFQFVSANISASEELSRLIGVAAIGGLIAAATRAVETARREAWLSIVAGGMTGKEFILYHPVTRIGASPDAEIFLLKDPAVAKEHAQILGEGGRRVLTVAPGAAVYVNGTPVTRHVLRNGDHMQIGNTGIAYSERAMDHGVA
jgi:hypothetical protein